MSKNAAIAGEDGRPAQRPVYCYAMREAGTEPAAFFLCNYDKTISIANLPAKWGATDPQDFIPASIDHGEISKEEGFSEQGFQVIVQIHNAQDYSRFILFGMIPKIEITVFKVTSGAAIAGADAEYEIDTLLVHSGVITDFTVQGFEIQVTAVPEPFLSSHQVPRWRFTRTCNHQLYSAPCGLDRSTYHFSNSILSIDVENRQLTISGELGGGITGKYWRGGVLIHTSTGQRLTIFAAEILGGNTVVTLHQWSPDLDITDNVSIFAGCDHTSNTCETKFANLANFGGFPGVPSKNPGIHGVS